MPRPTKQAQTATATRILDIAEEMVQVRGFNGFSYADVATTIGITTASLHYHFPGKAELGRALIERYSDRFFAALSDIEAANPDAPSRLRGYADLYSSVLREHRLCLCGMLAAEYTTLPQAMRSAVISFFDRNEAWLASVLEEGREGGELHLLASSQDTARMLVGALEGAMLIARPYGDVDRLLSAANQLIASLHPDAVVA